MAVSSMPITETVAHIYPRLLALHTVDPSATDLPPVLRCSIDKFQDDGVYLLGKKESNNLKQHLALTNFQTYFNLQKMESTCLFGWV